jgi:hypothetical protein
LARGASPLGGVRGYAGGGVLGERRAVPANYQHGIQGQFSFFSPRIVEEKQQEEVEPTYNPNYDVFNDPDFMAKYYAPKISGIGGQIIPGQYEKAYYSPMAPAPHSSGYMPKMVSSGNPMGGMQRATIPSAEVGRKEFPGPKTYTDSSDFLRNLRPTPPARTITSPPAGYRPGLEGEFNQFRGFAAGGNIRTQYNPAADYRHGVENQFSFFGPRGPAERGNRMTTGIGGLSPSSTAGDFIEASRGLPPAPTGTVIHPQLMAESMGQQFGRPNPWARYQGTTSTQVPPVARSIAPRPAGYRPGFENEFNQFPGGALDDVSLGLIGAPPAGSQPVGRQPAPPPSFGGSAGLLPYNMLSQSQRSQVSPGQYRNFAAQGGLVRGFRNGASTVRTSPYIHPFPNPDPEGIRSYRPTWESAKDLRGSRSPSGLPPSLWPEVRREKSQLERMKEERKADEEYMGGNITYTDEAGIKRGTDIPRGRVVDTPAMRDLLDPYDLDAIHKRVPIRPYVPPATKKAVPAEGDASEKINIEEDYVPKPEPFTAELNLASPPAAPDALTPFDYGATYEEKAEQLAKQRGTPYASFAEIMAKRTKDVGDDAASAKWLALAEAGFTMAAGESPHALVNIGKGAQQGVESLKESQQRIQERKDKNLALKMQLAAAQEAHKNDMARLTEQFTQGKLSEAQFNEAARDRRYTAKLEVAKIENDIKTAQYTAAYEQYKLALTLREGRLDRAVKLRVAQMGVDAREYNRSKTAWSTAVSGAIKDLGVELLEDGGFSQSDLNKIQQLYITQGGDPRLVGIFAQLAGGRSGGEGDSGLSPGAKGEAMTFTFPTKDGSVTGGARPVGTGG